MSKTSASDKRKTTTTNTIVLAILVSLVSLGLAGYIGKSMVGSIQLNAKILQKKTSAAAALKSNLEAAPKLVENYRQLGADKQMLIAHSLPIDSDYPGVIASIEKISLLSGLTLRSIAAGTSPVAAVAPKAGNVATAQEFSFVFSAEGSYASLKALLVNLELSSRPMKVNQISLGGTGSKLTIQLGATTYYQAPASIDLVKEEIK